MKKMAYCGCLCMLLTGMAVLQGCKKQFTQLNLQNATAYYPLTAGKVFVYRMDSTHLDVAAMQLLVSSWLVKDSVGKSFKDNTGRMSYPVYRFITDTLSSTPWQAMYTYYATITSTAAEVVDDNNLRFLKLVTPVNEGFSWNGNSYINTQDPGYLYMMGWNYVYQNVNMPFTTLKGNIDSTVTVLQNDDTSPPGPFDPNAYQERIYSVEVYGKGIGLVYKNFLHWTWQTDPPPAQYDKDSYGIVLNLISVK
jgi:hypothetical protein